MTEAGVCTGLKSNGTVDSYVGSSPACVLASVDRVALVDESVGLSSQDSDTSRYLAPIHSFRHSSKGEPGGKLVFS